MEDFLKDIKANSGYCADAQEIGPLYRSNFGQAAAKNIRGDVKIVDLNKTNVGDRSPENKTPPLSRQVFKSEISDPDHRRRKVTKTEFGADEGDGVSQLRDGKTEQDFVSETGCSFPAKNSIRTGKVSGNERARRSYETKEGKGNTKPAQWLVRDENLMKRDGRDSNSIVKNTEPRVNGLNSDFKESQVIRRKSKPQQSPSFLQTRKSLVSGDQGLKVQIDDTQLPGGKSSNAKYQTSKPRHSWTDGPSRNTDSPSRVGPTGGVGVPAVNRSQTAPARASRLQSQNKSLSVSERKLDFTSRLSTAKNPSSNELKIHVSLSKTERRKILQELICNSTVTPDRSFLERERQTMLKDKVSKFFESLFEQADTGQVNDEEEDIFRDDEDLQQEGR